MVFKSNQYRDNILGYVLFFSFGFTTYFLAVTLNQGTSSRIESEWQIRNVRSRVRLFVGENVVVGKNNVEFYLSKKSGKPIISCNRIHIAMITIVPSDIREAVTCLKTILYFRSQPFALHFIVDDTTHKILTTLFDTWQLPLVDVHYYEKEHISSLKEDFTPSPQTDTFLDLPNILPSDVYKVIAIDTRMRFFKDIKSLWAEFKSFSSYQVIGMPHNFGEIGDQYEQQLNLVLLDLNTLRLRTTPLDTAILSQMTMQEYHEVECSWNIQMGMSYPCPSGVKALQYSTEDDYHSALLEPALEKLDAILISNGDLLRSTSIPCSGKKSPVPQLPTEMLRDKCAEFYYSTKLKRRTHLFYMGTPASSNDPHEITLMTMFTLDRFDAFELMLKYWTGPVTVVAYVTDEEVLTLIKKLRRSEVIQNRSNIVYHVVYKRHRLYPINYVRNVALSNTHTIYSIFVDVDLVPNKGLYDYLKHYIKTNPHDNIGLIVPAFEAVTVPTPNPESRFQLMKLLKSGTVIPYGSKGYADGHSPTNYKKWENSSEAYFVNFEPKFEPYILMRTEEMPLYSEDVLDRMGDKAIFTADLHTKGYRFKVLPKTFLIHHPHQISDNKYFYQHEKTFLWCKHQLLKHHNWKLGTPKHLPSPKTNSLQPQRTKSPQDKTVLKTVGQKQKHITERNSGKDHGLTTGRTPARKETIAKKGKVTSGAQVRHTIAVNSTGTNAGV